MKDEQLDQALAFNQSNYKQLNTQRMENAQFAQLLIDIGGLGKSAQEELKKYKDLHGRVVAECNRLTNTVDILRNERATLSNRCDSLRAQVNELQIKLAERDGW